MNEMQKVSLLKICISLAPPPLAGRNRNIEFQRLTQTKGSESLEKSKIFLFIRELSADPTPVAGGGIPECYFVRITKIPCLWRGKTNSRTN